MDIQKISMTSSSTYNVPLLFTDDDTIKITTTVTNDINVAMNWMNNTDDNDGETILGLELQFYRHDSSMPAILTLCDTNRCLILQLRHIRQNPTDLKLIDLLQIPGKRFVGANVGHSLALLQKEYGVNIVGADLDGYHYQYLSDTTDIVKGGPWLKEQLGATFMRILLELMMDLMLMRKNPEVEGAVWEKENLEEDLVLYATLDSYVYYMIAQGHKQYAPLIIPEHN